MFQPNESPEITELSYAAGSAWLRFRKARDAARRARKKAEEADAAREELLREFGSSRLGRLPDGTLLVRTEQSREYKPLPARTISWWEFDEIPQPPSP